MRHRRYLMLGLMLVIAALTACQQAPAATPAATEPPATTEPPAAPAPTEAPATEEPPAAEAPTIPVLPTTSAAGGPPSSGGGAIAPTPSPTPIGGQITTGRGRAGWAQISAAGAPPARYDHTLTVDTASNKLVVFGGRNGSKTLGDTWVFDLTTNKWREVKSSPAPEARFGHAAAFDPKSKRVLIFAGQGNGFFNDVWAFDAAKETWQKIETKGTGPAARYGTSAVIDTKRNALIITHGFASGRFDDTFALDLATSTWSQIQPIDGQPLKRCLHESVYDARSDRMILFGGCSSGYGPCPQGDLWTLDAARKDWSEVSPKGIKPSARQNPALVGDSLGRLILFGGKTSDGPSADAWALDIASGEWSDLTPSAAGPAARSSHDAVWNPATKQVIVFGGQSSAGALNDLWVLTP